MSQLAFIGLGRMGLPMAARLLAAGHSVQVWNRSPNAYHTLLERCDAQQTSRLKVCEQAIQAVEGVSHVFTILTDGPAVTEVMFGSEHKPSDGGVTPHLNPGTCWVDMSSIPPTTARIHAERLKTLG
jgi:2-hydroxy-3-oxopropionate reductase